MIINDSKKNILDRIIGKFSFGEKFFFMIKNYLKCVKNNYIQPRSEIENFLLKDKIQ